MELGQMFFFKYEVSGEGEVFVFIRTIYNAETGESYNVFVKNSALTRIAIKRQNSLGVMDTWNISDRYYNEMVASGKFIPITDLREADELCEKYGCKLPDVFEEFNWD